MTNVKHGLLKSQIILSRCGLASKHILASSRRSVSQGAVQKTVREKIKKKARREEVFSCRAFFYFFARCFLRCALTERLEEAKHILFILQ